MPLCGTLIGSKFKPIQESRTKELLRNPVKFKLVDLYAGVYILHHNFTSAVIANPDVQ